MLKKARKEQMKHGAGPMLGFFFNIYNLVDFAITLEFELKPRFSYT
jgi:hypothetical protein